MDLVEGHVSALEQLLAGVHVYNPGNGKWSGVFEIIRTFEEVNGLKIPFNVIERRSGDLPESYAGVAKAKRELGWKRSEISLRCAKMLGDLKRILENKCK